MEGACYFRRKQHLNMRMRFETVLNNQDLLQLGKERCRLVKRECLGLAGDSGTARDRFKIEVYDCIERQTGNYARP